MIDTDKYEGHTPGPWVAEHMYWRKKGSHGGGLREEGAEDAGNYAESFVYTEAWLNAEDELDLDIPTLDGASCANGVVIRNMATANLVADAPLLLEEVKRLQKEVRKQSNIIGVINDLVYDDGSYNLTWDKFNEIMGMIE